MKKLLTFIFAAALLTACDKDNDGDKFVTLDFESVPSTSMAGPTAYGDNLYSAYQAGYPKEGGFDPESGVYDPVNYPRYTGYHDTKTDLNMGINISSHTNDYEFHGGGIAISKWNDMAGETYTNQCSVYYNVGGKGGHGGSSNFAVVSCAGDARIGFKTATTEREFDSFWVTNTTFAYMVMKNGDGQAPPLQTEKGYFKLIIKGYDASGAEVDKQIEVYLGDFRETNSPGILDTWKKVDLSSLGKIHSLGFAVDGTQENNYGLATPTYFCFDDLKIKL